jgi:nucleotide-binding universal stress UspA family protein
VHIDNVAHRSIVVGIDMSKESELALEWAAHEAARRHAPVHLLHAYSPYEPHVQQATWDPDPTELTESLAEQVCRHASRVARARYPTLEVRIRKEPAPAGKALVEASRTAHVVVVGARGLGSVRSLFLGSVSAHVAAHAHCPVIVVHKAATRTHADAMVILGVDGSRYSTGAIRFAFEQAAWREVGLTVVHAWLPDGIEGATVAMSRPVADWRELEAQERSLASVSLAGFKEEFPTVDVRRHVVRGHPVEELVRQSENACLLVVGTRGRSSLSGLLQGSVSQAALRRAHCPLAVVHPVEDAPTESDDSGDARRQSAVREHL